jgi:hypothetical protein
MECGAEKTAAEHTVEFGELKGKRRRVFSAPAASGQPFQQEPQSIQGNRSRFPWSRGFREACFPHGVTLVLRCPEKRTEFQ